MCRSCVVSRYADESEALLRARRVGDSSNRTGTILGVATDLRVRLTCFTPHPLDLQHHQSKLREELP